MTENTTSDSRDGAQHLRHAQAVLLGESLETRDFCVAKMLDIVLGDEGTDTWIRSDGVRI